MKPKPSRERDWVPYMQRALDLAREAELQGDIPVGAVIVNVDGKIIGEGYNRRELDQNPIAHAEVLALQKASEHSKAWRLVGCTLVVTLEPCVMCAGASSFARVDRVVFGTADERAGAMGSHYKIHEDKKLHHTIDVVSGVLQEDCQKMLLEFFRKRRQ